jgi:AcrR family transcriptional regulator
VGSDEDAGAIAPRQPGKPKVPRAVRERQMLEVAERAFAERGFHAASVDAIAEAAGISKPMVYAYFGSKEGLYRGCMEQARRRLFEAVGEAADTDAPPDERLWRGILAFFTFVDEQRDSWTVLFGDATGAAGPFAEEAAHVRRTVARLVGELLFEAAAAEGSDRSALRSTEPLAHALIGSAESLAGWWLEHREHPKETVALLLMNFAWMGFANLVRGERWSALAAASTAGGPGGSSL